MVKVKLMVSQVRFGIQGELAAGTWEDFTRKHLKKWSVYIQEDP